MGNRTLKRSNFLLSWFKLSSSNDNEIENQEIGHSRLGDKNVVKDVVEDDLISFL